MKNKTNYFKKIFKNENLRNTLMNYLNKNDIFNLLTVSKEINLQLAKRNQLLLEIIGESRAS